VTAAGLSDRYYAHTNLHGVIFQKKALFMDVYVVEKWLDAPVRQKVPDKDGHVLPWLQDMVTVEYQF
jgi:ABC-type transporter Mla maintaining outer membrane lipid asymmetry ATPase subunit MlaF